MSHETPIVVAPRPVRFFTRSDDFKVSFNDPALEEFLSILKPSLVATTSLSKRLTSPIHISPSAELKDAHIDTEASRNWLASTLLCKSLFSLENRLTAHSISYLPSPHPQSVPASSRSCPGPTQSSRRNPGRHSAPATNPERAGSRIVTISPLYTNHPNLRIVQRSPYSQIIRYIPLFRHPMLLSITHPLLLVVTCTSPVAIYYHDHHDLFTVSTASRLDRPLSPSKIAPFPPL